MNLRFEDWLITLVVLVVIFLLLTSNNGFESQNYPLIETLDPPVPTATTPSDEAWQNIASVYNSGNLTATLMTASDTLTANNLKATKGTVADLNVTGTTTSKTANITDLNVTGIATSKTANTTDLNVTGLTTVNRLYASGGVNAPGPDGAKYQTHFPWVNPSGQIDKNYIRGDTIVDGKVNMNGRTKFRTFDKQMCAGDNVRGPLTNVADVDACAEWCATNNTLCAQYYAPGKSCYCKNTVGFDLRAGIDRTGYSTVFTI